MTNSPSTAPRIDHAFRPLEILLKMILRNGDDLFNEGDEQAGEEPSV